MNDLQNQAAQPTMPVQPAMPDQSAQAAQIADQLKDLRDIHLPDPVSFWPLAMGWWALLVLIPILYFLIRFVIYRMRMPKYKKLAIQELALIQSEYTQSNNSQEDKAHETCGEIALLIRKALVAKLGNKAVAGLVTEEWLDYLDKLSQTDCFTNGTGRLIVSAPFKKNSDVNIDELFAATKTLLSRL